MLIATCISFQSTLNTLSINRKPFFAFLFDHPLQFLEFILYVAKRCSHFTQLRLLFLLVRNAHFFHVSQNGRKWMLWHSRYAQSVRSARGNCGRCWMNTRSSRDSPLIMITRYSIRSGWRSTIIGNIEEDEPDEEGLGTTRTSHHHWTTCQNSKAPRPKTELLQWQKVVKDATLTGSF